MDAKLAELDGTRFRERLGVNTMIAVSMVGARVAGFQRLLTRCSGACPQAVCRAGARAARLPLYRHIATLSGYVRALARSPARAAASDALASAAAVPCGARSTLLNSRSPACSYEDVVMPVPMITVLSGGPHSASPLPAQVCVRAGAAGDGALPCTG